MAEEINLTIQDIANAVAIIDTCVKRGAFEGSEITSVGSVRDKFVLFIEKNKAAEQKEPNKEVE